MADLHPVVADVTARIRERSGATRRAYLRRLESAERQRRERPPMACSNLAHSFAAAGKDREALKRGRGPVVAIVSSYNDMLSAHQPFVSFPGEIKLAIRAAGGVAQFAGGVPAMCDGITQGEPGMELSLFSRDVIAQATAVALSHDVFDAVICLGVCDKIVPGLLIGGLSFGHLPFVFAPAGPMPSGISNAEKNRTREDFARGKATREQLLEVEAGSYHSPGTCTFFGTANSNQMFMELMGLHLPGASFENPGTPLRKVLTRAAAQRAVAMVGDRHLGLGYLLDERSIVNGIVGLLATGGSTNHTIHLVAIARAAGIRIDWEDFDRLSSAVPLLAAVYPNGSGDVNDFHRAGGLATLIHELISGGFVHPEVTTIAPEGGLAPYARSLRLENEAVVADEEVTQSSDREILRSIAEPFQDHGGLRRLQGNLGRAVIKTSAISAAAHRVAAPARVFDCQEDFQKAFRAGELDRDLVAVVRFQGPRANGMPELHKLMPPLGVLQDRGYRVALVTDGRLSGASGKVPAAIHLTPEASDGGMIARLQDGDPIVLDAHQGTLTVGLSATELESRTRAQAPAIDAFGVGRELFSGFRSLVSTAEQGAWTFGST